ncbi:Uncharacterised protein [Citrobacter freundii]|nr:Uncharacterised protein [Citrobacter freundii]
MELTNATFDGEVARADNPRQRTRGWLIVVSRLAGATTVSVFVWCAMPKSQTAITGMGQMPGPRCMDHTLSTLCALSTMLSTVKPKNREQLVCRSRLPITRHTDNRPFQPNIFVPVVRQFLLLPPRRALTFDGRTDSRYASSWASKISVEGRETTRTLRPSPVSFFRASSVISISEPVAIRITSGLPPQSFST